MGLDVHLYQFKDIDTDVILELSRLAEEPYNNEEFQKWKAMPPSERGESFPSQQRKAEGYRKLLARAREVEFPETRFAQPGFGGTGIRFPSPHHPEWAVGDWHSFSSIRIMMQHFIGKDLYFIFPGAKSDDGSDIHGLFRPDWRGAREQLTEIIERLKHVESRERERVLGSVEWFHSGLNQLEVMVETLDFVLSSNNPREFLLFWSS